MDEVVDENGFVKGGAVPYHLRKGIIFAGFEHYIRKFYERMNPMVFGIREKDLLGHHQEKGGILCSSVKEVETEFGSFCNH